MSQFLTEEASRGWLDGAPNSPPAGPSGTLAERPPPPSPVNPTALGQSEIMTPDAAAIAPAPMMPNAATIPPSTLAHLTATGRLDTTTPSASTASSVLDVPTAGDPKPSKRRSTRIAGK